MPKPSARPDPEITAIMSSANTQVPLLPHQTATTDTTARYLHVNNAGTTAEDNDDKAENKHEHLLLRIARFPFHVIGTVLAWLLYPVVKLAIKAHFTSDLVSEHRADLNTLTHRVGQTVGLVQKINDSLSGLNREVLDVAKKSLDHQRDVAIPLSNNVKGIETQVVKIAEELVRLHESNNKLVVMEREAFEVAQLLAKESVQFPARLRKQLGDAGLPVIDMGHEELMLYILTMLDAPAPRTTALRDEASNFYDEPSAAKGLEAAAVAKLEVAMANEHADDDPSIVLDTVDPAEIE